MKGRKRKLGKRIGILAVSLLIAGGIYVRYAFYYENHYFRNTVIGGEDCSHMTPVEAEYLLYEKVSGYSLGLYGREEISDIILPKEIGMEYIFGDSMLQIKKEQNPALWIIEFFQKYEYEMPRIAHFDRAALEKRIEELAFFKKENVRPPKDAYITYVEDEGKYRIVDARPGTETKKEKVAEEIEKALLNLQPAINLDKAGCYKEAGLKEDSAELQAALELTNRYISAEIIYDWNGNQVLVDGRRIRKWIEVEGEKAQLNEKAVGKFVARQAEEYDDYGRNKFFQTTDGRKLELNNGLFGWQTDSEAETLELVKAIKNGETIKKQPVHTEKEPKAWEVWVKDTYVEIDLGRQHLYLYVDGEMLLESDFVSGNASRGWGTPAGVYGLTYKARNAVLRGLNYATPVSYWMPFNGNIGMHDATWRNAFGGDIYRTNGSHGCINLPYEKAKIIYEYMYTGFPVVCYY